MGWGGLVPVYRGWREAGKIMASVKVQTSSGLRSEESSAGNDISVCGWRCGHGIQPAFAHDR